MTKKTLLEKHKDIARIDQESKRTHGWYVRLRFRGVTKSKFFSDKKWDGRHSSLQAAISWRDETETAWGKPRTDRNMVMEVLRREGHAVNLGAVKQVIRNHPEWEAKLEREIFADPNIVRAMSECREFFGN